MLGVRHQAEDVAALVGHAGDVRHGAVRVRVFLVTEEDLPAGLEVLKEVGVSEETAFSVARSAR